MKFHTFIVDAFASKLFEGNPAAVCIFTDPEWPADQLLQKVAAENNQSETAFVQWNKTGVTTIRWFTPLMEVDLCGHATLASAHVLYEYYSFNKDMLDFHSPRSGRISAFQNQSNKITIDFPVDHPEDVDTPPEIVQGIGVSPVRTIKGKTDYMALVSSLQEVAAIIPNYKFIASLKARGLIVTAQGTHSDFVYRFFAPQSGIDEDQATGSALTLLAPFWSSQLGKQIFSSIQLSPRKGFLDCALKKDRVQISGYAFTYLAGQIQL